MIRAGYRRDFAAGIEASASAGGQIMGAGPPAGRAVTDMVGSAFGLLERLERFGELTSRALHPREDDVRFAQVPAAMPLVQADRLPNEIGRLVKVIALALQVS